MADFSQAVSALRVRREALVEQIKKIDIAIQALDDVAAGPQGQLPLQNQPEEAGQAVRGRGVRSRVLKLLEEYDRDWSSSEIVEAFQNRNDALAVSSPNSSVRTALSVLYQTDRAVKTTPGRYRAMKFALARSPASGRATPRALSATFKGHAVAG
jgi:hypothetical protein